MKVSSKVQVGAVMIVFLGIIVWWAGWLGNTIVPEVSVGNSQVAAAIAANFSSTASFAVLGGSTVTNTGGTIINGDLGLSPGTSVTGFPPGIVNGVQHITDALASQAQTDFTTAYNNVAAQSPATTVSTELGGTTKTTGIYNSADGTFGLTGTLTLDAEGDPDAVFIFQTASTLVTAGSSNVVLINGAQACNVFWKVGSSATLGTDSTFKGNIMALTSVTLTTGANVEGRVLAQNGAVTLDSNIITRAECVAPPPPPTPVPVIPTPTATTTPIPMPTPVVTPVVTPVSAPFPALPNSGINSE